MAINRKQKFSVMYFLNALALMFFVTACSEQEKPKSPPPSKTDEKPVIQEIQTFLMDGTLPLWKTLSWYSYEFSSHLIWSNLDVYAIKTKEDLYRFQIVSYYDPQNPQSSGFYTIRYAGQSGDIKKIEFNASHRPNPNNPNQNNTNEASDLWTFLDLETGSTKVDQFNKNAAAQDWDLAFQNTSIRMNAGLHGQQGVRSGLVYREKKYFMESGHTNFEELKRSTFTAEPLSKFINSQISLNAISFYPSEGQKRIISEMEWRVQSEQTGINLANKTKTWLVSGNPLDKRNFVLRIEKLVLFDNQQSFIELNVIESKSVSIAKQIKIPFEFTNANQEICVSLKETSYESCTVDFKSELIVRVSEKNSFQNIDSVQIWNRFGATGPFEK